MTSDRRTVLFALAAAAAAAATGAAAAAEDGVFVIAEVVAKPDKAGDLRAMFSAFAAKARKEPGCKHYSLLEDPATPGRFFTFETWADKGAVDAHMKTPDIQAFAASLKDILAKAPVITPLAMVSDG